MNETKKITHNDKWQPFEDARVFVQSLGLKTAREWKDWAKGGDRPYSIPSNPWEIYKEKGWAGMGDWLGTGQIGYRKRVYRSFPEARTFARSLGFKKYKDWKAWARSPERPEDIPANPNVTYKDKGWEGFGDWLGSGRIYRIRTKKSFEEARDYVRSLGLKSAIEWLEWCKSGIRPKDIPFNPMVAYKGEGWINMGDWLGINGIPHADRFFLPFAEARSFARNLGLNGLEEWQKWARSAKRPKNIPISPHYIYRNKGWKGYGDWLGTGRIGRKRRKVQSGKID